MARGGQVLVEYLLIIAVVAITLIASLAFLRNSVEDSLDSVPELSSSLGAGSGGNSPPGKSPSGNCTTPGKGAPPPGKGGAAPGQCRKSSN